jgi:FkbM family methyltransferase
MKLKEGNIRGIKFFYRENTSDLKTFEEVIGRDVYQKNGNKIRAGDFWYDCGGNVGAFSLLAIKNGAQVEAFEPDPFSCELMEKNLKANGFSAKINQAALVHDETKKAILYAHDKGQFWRNSLVNKISRRGLEVKCVKFDDAVKSDKNVFVKMDIEGMEMPIIENTKNKFGKLIFEWSFDIDPNLERYWRVLERLSLNYEVKAQDYRGKGVTVWPKSWFPACTNVFCYAKT